MIVTRSKDLGGVFEELGVTSKYGSSHLNLKQLLRRLDKRSDGACPALFLGIKIETVVDL